MPSSILDIKNARVFRESHCVFDNLSLNINAGEHVAILGPNGAGKTTLLKLLTRELYPVVQAGSHVKLFGDDKVNIWNLRNKIGVVSHELQNQYQAIATGLDVVMSAFFGSIGLYRHHQYDEQQVHLAEQALARLRIESLRDRQFLQLSTGQQRRLLIARATVHKPEVIVLDEPSSGLDISAAFQIIEDLRELAKQGISLILVTHHIQEIIPEIERIVILKEGKINFDGDKSGALTSQRLSEVFQTPMHVSQEDGYYQWRPARFFT
ncbi:ABC transporter ATP-binding protein [Agarilytica rhodophyticola]|uniref:ABC transporter ATP-binding protein n=1 Tax=Agarilytica rhodophyticola TaxID=1737490 RepID=UPI000B348432|nr:ATP-binding cassette domain-containing protein [Agarilytica rhodophyticola]